MAPPTHRSENGNDRPTTVTRRSVLSTIGGTAVGSALLAGTGEAAPAEITVVQGDTCFSVTPFEGDQPVEELYELRIPSEFEGDNGEVDIDEPPYYRSLGTDDLQQLDTTITFFYSGPDGLSLVVVHDTDYGDGGSVTWEVSNVPLDAEWAVKDDYYVTPWNGEQATTNRDQWDVDGSVHTVDWTWGDDGSDGGALRPLGDDFRLTVDPAFNEEATLWEQYYSGEVTDWQVLSGTRSDPDRIPLSLDEPVSFTTRDCGTPRLAQITVKPGTNDGGAAPINPQSRGTISVAIQETRAVNPGSIVASSLRFGPPEVVDAGRGATPWQWQRSDGTLLVEFPAVDANFTPGDTDAKLTGEMLSGLPIVGSAPVRTLGVPGGRGADGVGQDDDDTSMGPDDDDSDDQGEEAGGDEETGSDEETTGSDEETGSDEGTSGSDEETTGGDEETGSDEETTGSNEETSGGDEETGSDEGTSGGDDGGNTGGDEGTTDDETSRGAGDGKGESATGGEEETTQEETQTDQQTGGDQGETTQENQQTAGGDTSQGDTTADDPAEQRRQRRASGRRGGSGRGPSDDDETSMGPSDDDDDSDS